MEAVTCPAPSPPTGDSDELEFFDLAATNSPTYMNVTCCKIEADPIVTTCGQGESCVAQCRTNEGTLCPSGDCGNCLTFHEQPDEEDEGDGEVGRKRCQACQSSSSLRWCKRRGCPVGKHPICCFHPGCKQKRPNKCRHLSYFWGKFQRLGKYLKLDRNLLSSTWKDSPWRVDLLCSAGPCSGLIRRGDRRDCNISW